ncbi:MULTISPECIES: hypothetical protein [unclassified Microbacterium]|uniref:hypothetical protein n=1 Tax=unclassified Microbacterium TaxID=2609290 RepID=UPI0022F07CAC|nr:hypothetical protein [Streptomyces sp. MS2A]
MTVPAAPGVATEVPGRVTVSAQALRHLATALVGDAAHAEARDIGLRLSDAAGALAVAVEVPLVLSPQGGTTFDARAQDVRRGVMEGLRELADRRVARVDVRFTDVRRITARRAR